MKCRMLGVVLNAVDPGAPDYYYSYRYYPYSQNYGAAEAQEASHVDEGVEARRRVPVHDSDDDQEL